MVFFLKSFIFATYASFYLTLTKRAIIFGDAYSGMRYKFKAFYLFHIFTLKISPFLKISEMGRNVDVYALLFTNDKLCQST